MVFLGACAISNEGASDYRYYDANNVVSKYMKPSTVDKHQIKEGESLLVSLKQVYIKDFTEFKSTLRFFRGEEANGEIAIIVNAFEQGSGTRDFGPKGLQNGRVAFFSDDVEKGQFLNFSNLSTVYGPLAYKGNNFILDLYIVEFDQPGEQLKKLISNIKDLSKTFYPPSSPAANVISQMASTLITDEQDDIAFHYSFELKALGGELELDTGILLSGNYVFIREEDRNNTTDWANLKIDNMTGRLVYKKLKDKTDCTVRDKEYKKECFYTENTYVVMEVNKAKSSLKNDTQEMLYKNLVSELSAKEADIFTTDIPEDIIKNFAKDILMRKNFSLIMNKIEILQASNNTKISNNAALDGFLNLWYEKKDEGSTALKYEVENASVKILEENLGNLVASCISDTQEMIGIMDILRNRSTTVAPTSLGKLIAALNCNEIVADSSKAKASKK